MNDLPAGPELDRRIAVEVMGWTRTPNTDRYFPQVINKYGQPVLCVENTGLGYDAYEEVIFQPSRDIAHAWVIVDKIDLPDHDFFLRGSRGQWFAGWSHYRGMLDLTNCSTGETPSLAICRAALKHPDATREGM